MRYALFGRTILFMTIVIALLVGYQAFALSFLVPADYLGRYGIPMEEDILIKYLDEGLPEDIKSNESWKPEVTAEDRWMIYETIPSALGDLKSKAAIPVLVKLLEPSLPEHIKHALEVSENSNPRLSEPERAKNKFYGEGTIKCHTADALREIGDDSAIPALKDFLVREIQLLLDPTYPADNLISHGHAFNSTCRALADKNIPDGIPAAIKLLDRPGNDDPWQYIALLRLLTGQIFGPETDSPAHIYAREKAKWKAWWEANKDTFQLDQEAMLRTRRGEGPKPPSTELRDALKEGHLKDFGKPEARKWLEEHAVERVQEIAALMNDPDEQYGIRLEAMEWYARFGGAKAIDEIEPYAKCEAPFDPLDGTCQYFLARDAFFAIKKYCPDRAYTLSLWRLKNDSLISCHWAFGVIYDKSPEIAHSLAKDLLSSKDEENSAASVSILMKRPDGAGLVAEHIKKLGMEAQRAAVHSSRNQDGPWVKTILFEAVKNEDRNAALEAAKVITDKKMESLMPEDSLQAFNKLKERYGADSVMN